MLGILSIVVLLQLPAPFQLCSLMGECITAYLSGSSYFSGDSPASPVFQLRLVLGPMLSLLGVLVAARSAAWGVALTVVSVLIVGLPQVMGTYALIPFHPLVLAATLTTSAALIGGARRRTPN